MSEAQREQQSGQELPFRLERLKLINDLLTQAITLSTGSVVLITTFLERFASTKEQWRPLAVGVIVTFTVTIGFALISKHLLAGLVSNEVTEKREKAMSWTYATAAVLFFLAIGGLAVFGWANLVRLPSK